MTDITGNFGINAHKYTGEVAKKQAKEPDKCPSDDCKKDVKQTNLDKQPSAIGGRVLVNRANMDKGEYQFNPENVEEDVLTFQAVARTAKDLKADYMKKGLTEEQATAKVEAFLYSLLMPQQINS